MSTKRQVLVPRRRASAGTGRPRFHRFRWPRLISVTLCEPVPDQYVWMCIYLHPDLRNRVIAKEVVLCILHRLPGTHHVHFFPEITTLAELAETYCWTPRGNSRIFRNCVAYETPSLDEEPSFAPLLSKLLSHTISLRRPALPSFQSPRAAGRTVQRMVEFFGHQQAAASCECSSPHGQGRNGTTTRGCDTRSAIDAVHRRGQRPAR